MFVDEVVGVSSLTAHTANLVVPLLKKELQPSVVMTALMHESHDGHMTLAVPASFELLHFVLTITADRLSESSAPWMRHLDQSPCLGVHTVYLSTCVPTNCVLTLCSVCHPSSLTPHLSTLTLLHP